MKRKTVSFKITEDIDRIIKVMSTLEICTKSDVIEQLVQAELERNEELCKLVEYALARQNNE